MLSLTRWVDHCSSRRCDRSGLGAHRWPSRAGETRGLVSTSSTSITNNSRLIGVDSYGLTTRQIAEITDELRRGSETGALNPPPVEIVPFEKDVDAYSRMAAGQMKAKQVLSFD